jgi:hypothetical protein
LANGSWQVNAGIRTTWEQLRCSKTVRGFSEISRYTEKGVTKGVRGEGAAISNGLRVAGLQLRVLAQSVLQAASRLQHGRQAVFN